MQAAPQWRCRRRTCRCSSGACTLAWQPAAGAGQKLTRLRITTCPAQAHEPTTALERGAVLRGAVAAVVAAVAPTTAHAADAVDYKAVAADIAKIIKSDPDKGPTFLRLAWHSSGDYSKQAQDGGSRGGTIRFKEELAHGGNAGLAKAVKWLEPVKKAHPGASLCGDHILRHVR